MRRSCSRAYCRRLFDWGIAMTFPQISALVLAALLAGCGAAAVVRPTLDGALSLRRTEGPMLRLAPDQCRSGDREYFYGADFASAAEGWRLRAVRQPLGEIVLQLDAADVQVTLGQAQCARLDLQIAPTGWQINEIRDFAVQLDLDCTLPHGGRLSGRLSADHCH